MATPTAIYLDWIKSNGGRYNKIEFKDDGEGVGCVYTTAEVMENENFASVPFKLCITERVARKSLPTLKDFSGRIVLTFFLLFQKQLKEKSFYWPYINILPKEVKTPLFFDEDDLKFIANTNLESATKDRKAALFEDFNRALEHLPEAVEKNDVLWQDFLWCYSIYSSRSFPYQLIDPSSTEVSEVLFPLVDALNHKPNTKITWSRSGDVENGSLSFIAGQVFEAGDQIFNNYGPKSNEELLLGYGFCFEYNEHDYISLKPNYSQDPNREVKLKIVKQCGISSGNVDPLTFYIHRNNIPDTFFKLMRVLVMNRMETEYYSTCTDTNLLNFVGYRNELSMLSMTLALITHRLRAIRNTTFTVNDDTKHWQKFSLMYRAGQEEIFATTLKKVEEMKRNLIQNMHQDIKEKNTAPNAPFLSINNPEKQQSTIEIDSSSPYTTLDSVVITLKGLLNKDSEFAVVIAELFEDLSEEEDIVFMLALINERNKANSEWKPFFDKVASTSIAMDESLQEMYTSMMPEISSEFPETFDLNLFSMEAFAWADHLLNSYSIDNPLAIVPL